MLQNIIVNLVRNLSLVKWHLIDCWVGAAESIIITFDPRSTAESGCDYVRFYKNTSKSDYWGEEKHIGRLNSNNFPEVDGRVSIYTKTSRFVKMQASKIC